MTDPMIYQHGSDERDKVNAKAMGERITRELKMPWRSDSWGAT